MRRPNDRRIPIEAILQLTRRTPIIPLGLRTDVLLLPRAPIGPNNAASLALREEQLRLIRAVQNVESIAAADVPPIVIRASTRTEPAGSAPGSVVLQAALHVVKRPAIVGVDLVELPDRNVEDRLPGLAAIIEHRQPSVPSEPHTITIFR